MEVREGSDRGSAESHSPGNLLVMHSLSLVIDPPGHRLWAWGSAVCLNKPPRWSDAQTNVRTTSVGLLEEVVRGALIWGVFGVEK